MKIKYLGTAAAEGVPAIFCRCEVCRKSKAAGGRNIRTRSQSIIDDRLLLDFCPDTFIHTLRDNIDLISINPVSSPTRTRITSIRRTFRCACRSASRTL